MSSVLGSNYKGFGDVVDGYHGDPGRGHKFWVYPQNKPIVTKRWDTHLHPGKFCVNYKVTNKDVGWGIVECVCLGHGAEAPRTNGQGQLLTRVDGIWATPGEHRKRMG